jgi:hypothetical protein
MKIAESDNYVVVAPNTSEEALEIAGPDQRWINDEPNNLFDRFHGSDPIMFVINKRTGNAVYCFNSRNMTTKGDIFIGLSNLSGEIIDLLYDALGEEIGLPDSLYEED